MEFRKTEPQKGKWISPQKTKAVEGRKWKLLGEQLITLTRLFNDATETLRSWVR